LRRAGHLAVKSLDRPYNRPHQRLAALIERYLGIDEYLGGVVGHDRQRSILHDGFILASEPGLTAA
jgi:hypothetical protein